MPRKLAVVGVVVVVALALGGILVSDHPGYVAASALAPHTPDLANGKTMFFAGGCASCHAIPKQEDKTKLGGGLALGSPFGTFYVPNISSDRIDGIGAWNEAQFVTAMVKGTSPTGEHLFPAFPYTSYQRMTLDDIRDLFAYLKTLPPVTGKVRDHALPFPFNIRRTLGLWKFLFLDGRPFTPDPSQSAQWNRGSYLVNGSRTLRGVPLPAQYARGGQTEPAFHRRACSRRAGRCSKHHPAKAQELDSKRHRRHAHDRHDSGCGLCRRLHGRGRAQYVAIECGRSRGHGDLYQIVAGRRGLGFRKIDADISDDRRNVWRIVGPPMYPLKAIGLKVISALLFAAMSALVRLLGDVAPVGQMVFFRSAFAIVPVVVIYAFRGELASAVRTSRPLGQLGRGSLSVCGMFSNFSALTRLPLADATAISFASPLITVALAAVILKERVRVYRWTAVIVGFFGVIVMLIPHFDLSRYAAAGVASTAAVGSLLALTSAVCNAGTVIQTRRLTQSETTSSIVFYFSLICAIAGALTLPFAWHSPTWRELMALVSLGFLGGLAHIFLTESYRYAAASVVAPFDYSSMLWALLLGYWLFGELPEKLVYLGAAIVTGAGLFVIWRERQLGVQRARAAEGPPQAT